MNKSKEIMSDIRQNYQKHLEEYEEIHNGLIVDSTKLDISCCKIMSITLFLSGLVLMSVYFITNAIVNKGFKPTFNLAFAFYAG